MKLNIYCVVCNRIKGGAAKKQGISHEECKNSLPKTKAPRRKVKLNIRSIEYFAKLSGGGK